MRKINYHLQQIFAFTTFLTFSLISHIAFAQFTTTGGLTPGQIAERLQNTGVEITAVRIVNCLPTAQGGFDVDLPTNELGAIALGSTGIYMGTGPANNLAGPASNFLSGETTGLIGFDPNLSPLPGVTGSINDLCYIEVDIISKGDTIRFPFTFGSEEYPVYVNTLFNDAFGFFITGENPSPGNAPFPGGSTATGLDAAGNYDDYNLAIVPGTAADPVRINSINWGRVGPGGGPATNPNFYYHNLTQVLFANTLTFGPTPFPVSPPGQEIAMDGLTTGLVAVAAVVPCEKYTIKLKIADISDISVDSFVFIEKLEEVIGTEVPVDLGEDLEICLGETVGLQANTTHTNYHWDFFDTDDVIIRVSNDSVESFTGLEPGEYRVRLTIFEGQICENSDEIIITVLDRPRANFDATEIILCNVDGEIVLNATANGTNQGDNPSYQWLADGIPIEDATESLLTVFNPADDVPIEVTYSVAITNNETGCNFTENITVTYFPNPIMENLPEEVFTCGDSVTLDARALNLAEGTPTGYVWYYEPTGSVPIANSPILRAVELGVYTVEVTTNECITVQSVTLICPEDVSSYRINLVGEPGSGKAFLTWNAPSEVDNVEYFEIFGFDARYLSTKVGETENNQFTVTSLLNGIKYDFAVRPILRTNSGRDPFVPGAMSNVVTVYPSIVLANETESLERAFTVFPNPNEGNFNIRWEGLNDQNLKFTVFNVNGQRVYSKNITANSNGEESLSLNHLADGIYVLTIETDKGISQHKISIVR
ncbi:MAG: choice-of-anchor L domain-containing protein [Bernardetiaceae bacterium]|nr:choice-of-anchor L domain-containing protein [Bernardetiaceae bacterium]